jgi:L-ribulokinase
VSLGSAIFAFLATGTFQSVEEAQRKICSPHRTFEPDAGERVIYETLYELYRKLYFAFGQPAKGDFGEVLPALIRTAEAVRGRSATA